MFAAQRDRAGAVRVLMQRKADLAAASSGRGLRQAGGRGAGRGAGAPPPPTPAAPPPTAGPRPEPRRDVAGVTRAYRFDELVGTQGGLTALHFAASRGRRRGEGAGRGGDDPNRPSPGDQTTPMLIATIGGQFDVAAYLLEKGGDQNLASTGGDAALPPSTCSGRPRRRIRSHAYLQQQVSYLELMTRSWTRAPTRA